MKANTKDVLKKLTSTMDKLDRGTIDTSSASAQADLAKQFTNLLKYELERASTMDKLGGKVRQIEEE